ncbi:MAG: HD domain-containing phosphohydrolase [Pseudomonadota bacterium]
MNGSIKKRILVVDDEPNICEILSRWLTAEGYDCLSAPDGEAALEMLGTDEFNLMISDIMMPRMSGIDLLTMVGKRYPRVAVIMVTGVDDRKTAVLALELGAYGYVIKPFQRNEVIINVFNALERKAASLIAEEYDQKLQEKIGQLKSELLKRDETLILNLISAAGRRHGETRAHLNRVGLYSEALAGIVGSGWTLKAVEDIRIAAAMHDVGKVAIPDAVLLKPGPLSTEEFEVMKDHSRIGAGILSGIDSPVLDMAREIALHHHENWDGSGYPGGLAEERIPKTARIVAICDSYDALTHSRVYRSAYSPEKAMEIMTAGRGIRFDPRALDAFHRINQTILRIQGEVDNMDPGTGLQRLPAGH